MSVVSLTASYAMRITAYLARHPGEWVRGAALIADRTGVPRSYAARVLHTLGRAGLVHTKVGCHGGYRLARNPHRTSMLDIVEAVDGPGSLERCLLGHGRCSGKRNCALHPYWSKQRVKLERGLAGQTLAMLASVDDAPTAKQDHHELQRGSE